jgi:MoxR-like ATPase
MHHSGKKSGNCFPDIHPQGDLIFSLEMGSNHTVIYHASALTSAMITGGMCILNDADYLDEKCWACLASLLDDRKYVESIAAGVTI